MLKKIETYLPLFNGFNDTIWSFDYDTVFDQLISARQENGIFSDFKEYDLKIDNVQYERDIVQNFSEALSQELSDRKMITSIEVQKINRGSADVIIEANIDNIKDYIYGNYSAFCEFLKKRYTSYDGFLSYYSNDFSEWEENTKHFTQYNDGHRLGSILEFICYHVKIEAFNFYDDVMDNICPLNYTENFNEIAEKSDGSLFECFTMNGYLLDIAEYYSRTYENGLINELILNEKTLNIIKEYEENILSI